MRRNLTVIVGPNGSGKTTLMHELINEYAMPVEGLGTEFDFGDYGWPVLNVSDTPVIVIGKYSYKNILGGADLLHGDALWESLDQVARQTDCHLLMEGQRFGYGKEYGRLDEFCYGSNIRLKVVLLDINPRICASRIKRRQAKKKFHRRKPAGTGYYSLENIKKQRARILDNFGRIPPERKMEFNRTGDIGLDYIALEDFLTL